ncbi:MAG TPA: anaerobic ribonucleoside-triphosphate reductase [Syntrophales bacterium]|nr:anaerobic ribonucleoside-triphosphate reductase [Syntrophales bacterium]HOL59448.1 anaerobic ribonucleoside-triphosphate reductase [Syntrophales bacterium]HPO34630.1 anaerobic ribonucleoside-triphosphate reductase [Syntrophales bacterium]
MKRETTDLTLFVRRTEEEIAEWDRGRIVDALVRETGIGRETAEEISREVEKQIFSSGVSLLTSQLIRELVNAKLIERGLEEAVRRHARLGLPLYDVENFILHPNRERASVPHGPEGTNMILAEGIKRDYALNHVFSRRVAEAHIRGDIHLHDLGFIDRVAGVHDSLVRLKKTGLDFPSALTVAKPARHAEVLLAHLIRFTALMRAYVSGPISWEAVNISFAPYTEHMGERELRQFAQMFVYEFSQLPSATGGQSMFTDIHLYWDIPTGMVNWPMIGPGGEETKRSCGEYQMAARRLARAFIEVYRAGDGQNKPFVFPRPVFHLSRDLSQGEDRAFMMELCALALEKGNPCLVFETKPVLCPRLIVHNCAINLSRLGYRARGDEERLVSYVKEIAEVVAAAHREKKEFLERMLSYGEEGPFAPLTGQTKDGPYWNMKNAFFVTGLIGLNELSHLHQGACAPVEFSLSIAARVKVELEAWGKREKMSIVLGQLPAEAVAHRFARLDLRYFSPLAGRFVRGDLSRGEIYYTDSQLINPAAEIKAKERLHYEGEFHDLLGEGATCYLWLGNEPIPVEEVVDFVSYAYGQTKCKELVLAPDFTLCRLCGQAVRGIWEACPNCGAKEVDYMSIITQYFSRVSWWNRGKRAELRDRFRYHTLLPY